MTEWKKYKLKEVATFEISGVDKKSKDGQKLVRLCNFVDVYKNWAITKEHYANFMVASAKDSDISKLGLKKGQVAITKDSETRDDIGVATYIADDFEDVVLGYHCALITPNPNLLDGAYLNAFMHSKYIQRYFENNATGSGMRYTLSVRTIEDIPLLLPDLPTQKRIASVLSNIDRKIALNRAMNEELEQTARDLYNYWFLQFDFPDANGNPYRSSGGKMVYNDILKREIPQGWEVGKLKDILDIEDSKRVPLSSKVRSQMQGKYPYYGATGILDYVDDYIFDGEYILLAEDGSTSTVNGKCVTQFIWGKSWVNNHAHILVPKMTNTLSYHFLMLQQIPAKLIETGSIQKKISQENLMRYNVQVPQQELILKFCAMINSIKEQYKINTESIDHLRSLRDELLPLLMNGQVEVKE